MLKRIKRIIKGEKMTEKFKVFLENGEIQLKIGENKYELSKNHAVALRYELYEFLELQDQYRAINWKPPFIEENF
jgi:hypothetical protein